MNFSPAPELWILAPTSENARKYPFYIRAFVDAGVFFSFGEGDELPRELPQDWNGLRCVMIDPAQRAEYSKSAHLLEFERRGGYVFYPDLTSPMGATAGDVAPRHWVSMAILAAGLTAPHPRMIENLQSRDEAKMVTAWKRAAPDELAHYARMGTPFRDPTGFIIFRAVTEAAEYFDDETLAAPVWEFIAEQLPHFGEHGESCGGRFLLKLYEQSGEQKYLDAVTQFFERYRYWRHDGVFINQPDYGPAVPIGANADDLPVLMRDNIWTWPENGANLGDTAAYFSRVTGDATWQENAVSHILQAHHWLFDEEWSLWRHVGRQGGPDKRSAIWARGVVWFLFGVRGLLEDLPEGHEARPKLMEFLRLGWQGLQPLQREDGLWSNVLDAPLEYSRAESSCTAHFIEIYGRALWRGWLQDESLAPALERAWLGLKTKVWDNRMLAYCVGTGFGLNRHVYLSRPHDSNRTSRSNLLWAWIELQRMRGIFKSDQSQ